MPQKDCFQDNWKEDKNMVMISSLELQNSKPLKLKCLSYSLLYLKTKDNWKYLALKSCPLKASKDTYDKSTFDNKLPR